MAMVRLRHIDGAIYNEIGDLIGDGASRVAARTGCVIRRNAYPPLLVNPSGSCWPPEVQPTPVHTWVHSGAPSPPMAHTPVGQQ